MKLIKYKHAFTLVELIIAIAIISIILIAFLSALSSGYINILSNGSKTKAINEAQSIIDYMDTYDKFDEATIVGDGGPFPRIKGKVDIANLYSAPIDLQKPIYYSVESVNIDTLAMNKITVLVYYQNGKRSVNLSVLLP